MMIALVGGKHLVRRLPLAMMAAIGLTRVEAEA